MNRYLLLAFLLTVATVDEVRAAYSFTGLTTIVDIYPNGSFAGLPAGTIVQIAAAHNPENCTYGTYYFLSRSSDGYNDILATLLMAFASNRQVSILVEGCGTTAWAGPLIKAVRFQ
jgi:hypothetical protein